MAERSYSKSADFPNGIWPDILQDEIFAVIPTVLSIDTSHSAVDIYFSAEPDDAILDGVIAAHGLSGTKGVKIDAIDARTRELVAEGFQFSGQTFSLSASAQSTLLGLNAVRDDPALTYPIIYNNLDDTGVLSITDSTMMRNFFLTALGTCRAKIDSGTSLKEQVHAATTVAQVNAIVDNR